MPEQQVERGWIQGWLDTVLALPWTERTDDELDVTLARAVLDADHTGLDEVKERIVELLAVRKLRAERGIDDVGTARRKPGAILALVGPPGVGKTSRSASRSRAASAASSCGSPSAACATKPRSAATAAPTSAPSRAASSGPSPRPAR